MKLKTFYVRAAAAAAAALLFLYPFPAHAADSAALQGQVSAAQREYESAASTLDSMQQQASDTRQQVNDLESQTDALRGQLGSIVAQLEQSRTELAEAQNQATAAAKALEEKQAAFSARYDSCKQQLTAMQLLNEGGEISLLMQADDLYELLTFWQVLNDLTEHNKQLLDELDAEAQALDTQQQASDTRQQVNDLESQTDALRGQLGSIVAQLEQSRTELAEAQNQATAAAKALEEKQAAFSARYDSCKQQLTAMQLLNEGGEISLLMQADDLYELLTFWQVLNDLTEHNKQLLDELDAEAQALDTQRQQAEAAATQAEQAAQALQARQDELTQTQIQLEQALQQASTELDSQQAAAEAQAAVTEEKRKAYEQATAALDAYLKAQSQKYQDPARHCSLDFTCPLPSVGRISTYFGEPDAVYNKPHTGADMPAASGTLIYAVADGVVSAASARPSYGNCVQIDHGTADDGSSYATLYAHMSSFCVSAGQTVHKGDVIGYVGNTGDVRGANGGYHLHLELRINGTRTDPLQYIPH